MGSRERITWVALCLSLALVTGVASGVLSWRAGRTDGFELAKAAYVAIVEKEVANREPRRHGTWAEVAESQRFKLELREVAPWVLNAAKHPHEYGSANMLAWWEQNRPRYVKAMGERVVEDAVPSASIPLP